MSHEIFPLKSTTRNLIASWSVLCDGKSSHLPPADMLWKWYADREKVQITQEQKLSLLRFDLKSEIPVFYWIRELKNADIRRVLLSVIRDGPPVGTLNNMMIVASFLGKGTYSAALAALGSRKDRLKQALWQYPKAGPKMEFGTIKQKPKQSLANLRRDSEAELNRIAQDVARRERLPGAVDRFHAHKLDCFLYAQHEKYK